jgi:hypothetical protein
MVESTVLKDSFGAVANRKRFENRFLIWGFRTRSMISQHPSEQALMVPLPDIHNDLADTAVEDGLQCSQWTRACSQTQSYLVHKAVAAFGLAESRNSGHAARKTVQNRLPARNSTKQLFEVVTLMTSPSAFPILLVPVANSNRRFSPVPM